MKHIIQAFGAFARRYAKVARLAWQERHSLQNPARDAQALEFLPAHLELIERPVSPTARWTMAVLIAFFCIALLWSFLGHVDIVAVASGRTVVDSRTKVVQPSETAVVHRILVRDGQVVAAGEPLVELDATSTAADHSKAGETLFNARLAALRLRALSQAVQDGQAPVFGAVEGLPPSRVEAELALARSQYDALQARRQNLLAVIEQRQAELHTTEAAIAPMEESARITRLRAEDYGRLVEGNYVGRHDYLLREQERIAADRDLAVQRNRAAEIRSSLVAAREELRVLVADFRQQTLDGLRTAEEQIGQATPELAKAGRRDRLMTLRAPVAGTVQQLAVHSVGGVVTPAQVLLAVVPSEDALEIEANVLNKDIGFVRPGQLVTVKVESFPYTRYGYLTGKVTSISHDAAQDEQLGLVFPARIHLERSTLQIDGVKVNLSAGMTLSAEIKTGKRRVLDYLLSPLQRHVDESLRER
ncbi:HlyD family type I secretion periplasmic adaptor subunit [Stenotrophomonas sp. HMWF003]|uniref:HlyD family type I secretion periplasmic adaptor subunit n=1 Tax=Stenotrophomonas sp. HMWF003 TaxID=2056840 RepID=UPI000D472EC9|nr:HlyD family type I secretion periplasmic adaptor subunit [Stenotrophomonas sp. HMWF003]PTT63982.1 hemolysin secretion protein D [Stenotrophomonas sp. HMWF003]